MQEDLLNSVDADLDGLFAGLDMSSEAWNMMFHNADLMQAGDSDLTGQISLGAETTVEKVSCNFLSICMSLLQFCLPVWIATLTSACEQLSTSQHLLLLRSQAWGCLFSSDVIKHCSLQALFHLQAEHPGQAISRISNPLSAMSAY